MSRLVVKFWQRKKFVETSSVPTKTEKKATTVSFTFCGLGPIQSLRERKCLFFNCFRAKVSEDAAVGHFLVGHEFPNFNGVIVPVMAIVVHLA